MEAGVSHVASDSAWATIRAHPELSTNERLVLLAIADRINGEGKCWPTAAELATDTRLHRVTVQAALKGLDDKGIVQREHQARPNGLQTRSDYRLVSSTATPAVAHDYTRMQSTATPRGQSTATPQPGKQPGNKQPVHPSGVGRTRKPRKEPSIFDDEPKPKKSVGNPAVQALYDAWAERHPGEKPKLDGADFRAIKQANDMQAFDAQEVVSAMDSVPQWGDQYVRTHPTVRTVLGNLNVFRTWQQPLPGTLTAVPKEEREARKRRELVEQYKSAGMDVPDWLQAAVS